MNSAATEAKRKEIITSKQIEVARRTEFGRTNFAATYQKNFYRTNMNTMHKIGMEQQRMDDKDSVRGGFAKTHL